MAGRDLRRSARLFASFRVEQTDPQRFYGDLARDSLEILGEHVDVGGASVLDVGAGPREFADVFRAAGARYVPLDHDPSVESVRHGGLVGSAQALPLATGSFDLVFSSNLWEHVPDPPRAGNEMLRVLRPGGLLFLSYTNWLSPWGGHEASPWHYLGAEYAARRYERRHGHPPKNRVGETMYRVSIADGLAWAASHAEGPAADAEVLVARPRYLPDAYRHVLAVPGLRELVTWNLLLILRKR